MFSLQCLCFVLSLKNIYFICNAYMATALCFLFSFLNHTGNICLFNAATFKTIISQKTTKNSVKQENKKRLGFTILVYWGPS